MISTSPPYGFTACSADDAMHAIARLRLGKASSLRENLMTALTSPNTEQSLSELDPVAEQLGAFELVVYIYALLEQPFVADHYETLAKCLFKLAYRLFSLHSISEQKWEALLKLLGQRPKLPEVAKLLGESRFAENDQVGADFAFDTWNALGSLFSLSTRIETKSFKKVFLHSVVPRVLDDRLLSSEKCFQSFVFVECLCSDTFDAEVRLKQDACQLFVLETLSKSSQPKNIAAMFHKCNVLFIADDLADEPQQESPLCTQFSIGALEWMHYILIKTPDVATLLDPTFVLGVIANPANAPTVKYAIVFQLIKDYKSFELSFLGALFSCPDLPEQLIQSLFSKDWAFDKIRLTYETENLKPHYYKYIQQLLDACPPSRRATAKQKCVLAVKAALENYIFEDKNSSRKLDDKLKELRSLSQKAIISACQSIIEDINNK